MDQTVSLRPVCAGFAVVPCSSRGGHVSTFGRMNSSEHLAPLSGGQCSDRGQGGQVSGDLVDTFGPAVEGPALDGAELEAVKPGYACLPICGARARAGAVGRVNRIASSRIIDRIGYFEAVRQTTAASDVEINHLLTLRSPNANGLEGI
jgi:hypothetical protein